jgi:hypothetical protein
VQFDEMDFKIQMMGLSHFNCQPSGKIRYKRLTRRTTSPQLSDIILYSSFSVALVTGGQALKCQGKTILYPPLVYFVRDRNSRVRPSSLMSLSTTCAGLSISKTFMVKGHARTGGPGLSMYQTYISPSATWWIILRPLSQKRHKVLEYSIEVLVPTYLQ